jgi:hypothetical protein
VFLTAAEDHLDGERLPAAPTDPERIQLELRLVGSGREHAAIAVDPLAAPAAAYAEGKTLAQLTRDRCIASDTTLVAVVGRAERIRERQVNSQALVEQPASGATVLRSAWAVHQATATEPADAGAEIG